MIDGIWAEVGSFRIWVFCKGRSVGRFRSFGFYINPEEVRSSELGSSA